MTYNITYNAQFSSQEIYFDGKPSDAVRSALKELKFRWHSVKRCWYGYASEETIAGFTVRICQRPSARISKLPASRALLSRSKAMQAARTSPPLFPLIRTAIRTGNHTLTASRSSPVCIGCMRRRSAACTSTSITELTTPPSVSRSVLLWLPTSTTREQQSGIPSGTMCLI